MKVLIIIPAYNEEKNIQKVVESVNEYIRTRRSSDCTIDYIVINDGSTDSTAKVCVDNNIKVINLIHNLGIGGAVQTGYIYARIKDYDVAVQFDGDNQHDIRSLDNLLEPVLSGKSDFVIGSRFIDGKSAFKSTFLCRLGIRYLSGIIRLFTGKHISDPTSGYRAANKKAICFLSRNYPVDYPEPESLVWLAKKSFSISEVQVNMFERQNGKSSICSWKSAYYMFKVSLAVICTSFLRRGGN